MPEKLTQHQFQQQLQNRNNTFKLVVALEKYKGRHTKILFNCAHNHGWYAMPNNVLKGFGCPHCSGKAKKTTESFIRQLNDINLVRENKVFLIPNQEYVSSFKHLLFSCNKKHTWKATPSNIINSKQTCKICAGKAKKTTKQFIQELASKRDDVFLVKGQQYKTAHTKLTFLCKENHRWWMTPSGILYGYGCKKCANKGYSQKAITWLNNIAKNDSVNIQHVENGGEYVIPGTMFKADGYCKENNTVYEFWGDYWHGNPKKFKQNELHPVTKKTYGEMYEATQRKRQTILNIGYKLIEMWESEYDLLNA